MSKESLFGILLQISYKLGQEAKILFKHVDWGTKAVVINSKGSVLLVRHSYKGKDLWYLPGGAIQPGEGPDKTIEREVFEETGIKIVSPHLIGVYAKSVKPVGYTFLFFATAHEKTSLPPSSEIEEAKFFERENFPHNLAPGVLKRVSETFQQLRKDLPKGNIIWGKW